MRDFLLFSVHLEHNGSLSYVDLLHVDTFHCTVLKITFVLCILCNELTLASTLLLIHCPQEVISSLSFPVYKMGVIITLFSHIVLEGEMK